MDSLIEKLKYHSSSSTLDSRHSLPFDNPVPLNQQRHLLDAAQHRSGVDARGKEAHEVGEGHHLNWRPTRCEDSTTCNIQQFTFNAI